MLQHGNRLDYDDGELASRDLDADLAGESWFGQTRSPASMIEVTR